MNFIKGINLPELLAPAGSLEHLKAAVNAGADAVYMGGEKFGARAYAHNFSREDMIEALQFAHFHERKLYLTVNTLMKEKELFEELGDFLLPYYENGLDGVIVQDFGAVRFIRENFPGMEIHGSTQMTITDVHGAVAAKKMGMTRVVPARELSLREIKQIKEETGLDIEVFVHGALCYCYSGQCLLSSLYGGRSGNRGRCAQPCRMPYTLEDMNGNSSHISQKGKYLLSPKDLCSLSVLPQLMEIPVDSLKIEGRMKNVEYVAGVTAIYRKYLDELAQNWEKRQEFAPKEEDIHTLEELYCRDGFTKGYWMKHNGQDMMSVISPKNTGRRIGKICSVSKNKIQIQYEDTLHPRDILVIPVSADRQEELILTVPSKCQDNHSKRGRITLNVPRTQALKPGMMVYRRKNIELSEHIEKNILNKVIKYPVTGDITLKVGEPLMLELFCREECAFIEGPVVEASDKRPVSKEDILRQMNKTGNVPFTLESFEVNMEENCFLPMSVLKKVRQQGFALLEELLNQQATRVEQTMENLHSYSKADLFKESRADKSEQNLCRDFTEDRIKPERIATLYDREQIEKYYTDSFFEGICLPYEFFLPEELIELARKIKKEGKKVYLSLPHVFRNYNSYDDVKKTCLSFAWDGIYAQNINEAEFLNQIEEDNINIIAGASLYHWNSSAVKETQKLYPQITVRELPMELSETETEEMFMTFDSFDRIKDSIDKTEGANEFFELLIYGRVPVMKSAQCLKKTTGCCNKTAEILYLKDKKGRSFPVSTHCRECYNLIWQDCPRNLIGENIGETFLHVNRHRFDLFCLKEDEIEQMKQRYLEWEQKGFSENPEKEDREHHWNYGIE